MINLKKFLGPVVALTIFANTYAQTSIVDDAMTGTRTDAPSSTHVQWFIGGSAYAANTGYGSGALSVKSTAVSATAQFLGYFSNSAVNLSVGQSLTTTFSFKLDSLPGSVNGDLRFGLFNSSAGTLYNGSSRVTADNYTAAGPNGVFSGYTGYAAMMAVNNVSSPAALRLYQRNTVTSTGLIGTASVYGDDNATTNPLASVPFQALSGSPTYHTGTLTATLTSASTLTWVMSLTGGSLSNYSVSYVDNTPAATAFDTFAIYYGGNTMGGNYTFTLDSFSVAVGAVPEPSTYAFIAGLAGLGLASLRRRSRHLLGNT